MTQLVEPFPAPTALQFSKPFPLFAFNSENEVRKYLEDS